MTEREIIELYEERLAIMQEGSSKDLEWFDTDSLLKRIKRKAYFDIKLRYQIEKMPKQLYPD